MKLNNSTALGIDISDDRINIALLRKNKSGVELVKTASGPVIDGAIKNGNIEDVALLAKSIRELRKHSRMRLRLRQAAVSLVAKPVLLQIMEMPAHVPTSVGQFVHNEVKHCVVLSGKRIAMDFCGIGSGGKPGSDRLFVVASDNHNVAQIVKACNLARVNVEVIEPSVISYARAFYAKKIAGKFDCNILLATVQGGTLTLCVFRRQTLDFIRSRDIDQDKSEPAGLCGWLVDEINAVVQFYDSVESSESSGRWEIIVIADSVQLPDDVLESQRSRLTVSNLQIKRPEDAYQDTPIVRDNVEVEEGASAVAVGLAMKLLLPNETNLRINMLPPEAADVKSLKRHALITANILAAILFIMIIAIAGLGLQAKSLKAEIERKKSEPLLSDLKALVKEEKIIDSRIKQLSGEPGRLNEILDSREDVDWPALLNDIRKGTPKTVCITSMFNKGNTTLNVEGVGLSYEAIRWFVNMLGESKHIATASLTETEKDDEKGGLIRYSISCLWTSEERK
jgi:Tfp pilus assembly protein PilN